MKVLLEVEVESKQEDDLVVSYPDPTLVAAYVTDYMRDVTRGDYELNWMIRKATVVEVS